MKHVSAKAALDTLKPETCVFVISTDGETVSGMVAGWNMRCSKEPPLFAVSIAKKKYTCTLIQKSKEFVIAVPTPEQEDAVRLFGSTHGNEIDKFAETGLETEPAQHISVPLIKHAMMNCECKLYQEVDVGTHIIFIGEVLASYIGDAEKKLIYVDKIDGKKYFKEF